MVVVEVVISTVAAPPRRPVGRVAAKPDCNVPSESRRAAVGDNGTIDTGMNSNLIKTLNLPRSGNCCEVEKHTPGSIGGRPNSPPSWAEIRPVVRDSAALVVGIVVRNLTEYLNAGDEINCAGSGLADSIGSNAWT